MQTLHFFYNNCFSGEQQLLIETSEPFVQKSIAQSTKHTRFRKRHFQFDTKYFVTKPRNTIDNITISHHSRLYDYTYSVQESPGRLQESPDQIRNGSSPCAMCIQLCMTVIKSNTHFLSISIYWRLERRNNKWISGFSPSTPLHSIVPIGIHRSLSRSLMEGCNEKCAPFATQCAFSIIYQIEVE